MFNNNVNGTEVKADKYEDAHAIFMLTSMFNQFPANEVTSAFKGCNKNFFTTMNTLLEKQRITKTSPIVAQLPQQQKNLGRGDESPPIKNHKLSYYALKKNFDYKKVVRWKTFDLQKEAHLRLLKGECDPISLDPLLEIGMSGEDEIVQLPCATKKMRCNFSKMSIVQCFQAKPECPVCKTFYPLPGKQPTGTLQVSFNPRTDCEGFAGDGSIILQFNFPSGVQGPNHPNPGIRYTGSSRTAYLPHVQEGKKALVFLEEAFKRGELFTIGKSLTSGAENQLTYGSIHLKTSPSGGTSMHGWPDFTYFQRLRDECAAKMIFDPQVQKDMDKALRKKQFKKII